MKKKLLMLILAAMLTLSATACGSAKDTSTSAQSSEDKAEESSENSAEESEAGEEAEGGEDAEEAQSQEVDALTAALEKTASVTNMEGQMVMEMNMEVSADGESQALESVTTMDMTFFADPFKLKMEMNMDAGEAGSVQQSVYGEITEDGDAVLYMYDGENWVSQVVATADLMQYNASGNMLSLINNEAEYTLEGMEKVDGINTYKYSSVVEGEEAKQQMLSSGALDSLSSLGLDWSQLETLLDDIGSFTEYVWIDTDSLYPIKYECDMTQVMDTLMSGVIGSLGEQAEGLEMSVSKMKISMTCSDFNNAADFTIPEEAKAE